MCLIVMGEGCSEDALSLSGLDLLYQDAEPFSGLCNTHTHVNTCVALCLKFTQLTHSVLTWNLWKPPSPSQNISPKTKIM